MRIRTDREHSPRVEGPHGLVCVGEIEWRNRYGTRRGRLTDIWLVFICNDTDCRARTLVHSESLGRAIDAETNGARVA